MIYYLTLVCETHGKNSLACVGSHAGCAALPSTAAVTDPPTPQLNRFYLSYFEAASSYC